MAFCTFASLLRAASTNSVTAIHMVYFSIIIVVYFSIIIYTPVELVTGSVVKVGETVVNWQYIFRHGKKRHPLVTAWLFLAMVFWILLAGGIALRGLVLTPIIVGGVGIGSSVMMLNWKKNGFVLCVVLITIYYLVYLLISVFNAHQLEMGLLTVLEGVCRYALFVVAYWGILQTEWNGVSCWSLMEYK